MSFYLTHPPLMDKNNKKTCCFFGLFNSFGSKKNFENFSTAPPTTGTHWSNKLLSPHHHHQPLTPPIATSHHSRWWQWWMVAEVGGLIVMGVSDSRWWVAVVPCLTTTATHWSQKLLPPPPWVGCLIMMGVSVIAVGGLRLCLV